MSDDLNGVIGTGQSLAVGTKPVTSTVQPYGNLKLSLGSAVVPPWDPEQASFELVPLTEPLRPLATEYPSSYPANLYGETLHAAMANQVSALVRAADPTADHVTVHSVVGECGQGMVALQKHDGDTTGVTGRSYAAALFEIAAIARLARAQNKTFGVRALVVTHGETDWESPTYRDELVRLLDDLNRDVGALTGQKERIVAFLSQQFAFPTGAGQRPLVAQTQWRLGVERPGEFVCTGPKYQYEGEGDGLHLLARGYQALGEKNGQVYFERFVRGRDWQPLHPLAATRSPDDPRLVSVRFFVPVAPLVWDETLPPPTAWPNGRGFEAWQGEQRLEILSVALASDTVTITLERDAPAGALTIGYAMTTSGAAMKGGSGSYRWGSLRDSDPFVGSTTGMPQPNFCVSFWLETA